MMDLDKKPKIPLSITGIWWRGSMDAQGNGILEILVEYSGQWVLIGTEKLGHERLFSEIMEPDGVRGMVLPF